MASLAAKIAAVEAMTPTALREAWVAQEGSSANGIPPSLLARAMAQQLQTSRFGGLDQRLRRHLDRLCADSGKNICVVPSPDSLSSGSQLLREWRGTTHKVLVLDDGLFRYDGRDYRSLSSIAKHITGAHWSGPRFFGIGS